MKLAMLPFLIMALSGCHKTEAILEASPHQPTLEVVGSPTPSPTPEVTPIASVSPSPQPSQTSTPSVCPGFTWGRYQYGVNENSSGVFKSTIYSVADAQYPTVNDEITSEIHILFSSWDGSGMSETYTIDSGLFWSGFTLSFPDGSNTGSLACNYDGMGNLVGSHVRCPVKLQIQQDQCPQPNITITADFQSVYSGSSVPISSTQVFQLQP